MGSLEEESRRDDNTFHNIGIGWNPAARKVADEGRYAVTRKEEDRGSIETLRDTVEHYNKGGNPNPNLDPKITKLNLTRAEVTALVRFIDALKGSAPEYEPPAAFPK